MQNRNNTSTNSQESKDFYELTVQVWSAHYWAQKSHEMQTQIISSNNELVEIFFFFFNSTSTLLLVQIKIMNQKVHLAL